MQIVEMLSTDSQQLIFLGDRLMARTVKKFLSNSVLSASSLRVRTLFFFIPLAVIGLYGSTAMAEVDCDNPPVALPMPVEPVGPGEGATLAELGAYIAALEAYQAALRQFQVDNTAWQQQWLVWHYECSGVVYNVWVEPLVNNVFPWPALTSYPYPNSVEIGEMRDECEVLVGQARLDCYRNAVSQHLDPHVDADCSDHSSVLSHVLNQSGIDYSLQCSGDHSFVWVQDASGCYLLDSANDITVRIPCPSYPTISPQEVQEISVDLSTMSGLPSPMIEPQLPGNY